MLGAPWVEYIHDELLQRFWPGTDAIGSKGVKDRGLLESAVARPFQSVFGQDAYPAITGKAAALFHSLVANHPFHDGNKRTAVTSLHHFLLANSFFLSLNNEELYELAKSTASYRARGLSHDQAFLEIQRLLESHVSSFESIEERLGTAPAALKEIYMTGVSLRRWIRRSRKNGLVAFQPPSSNI